ncbi:cation:proton antiporter [Kitasatospora sp. NPDC098652]|uniref:cation:proton antiporter n=1 Tax=Kitasatospora sp. NPDC098652 TaxID=3364095 RepID=UPI003804D9D7
MTPRHVIVLALLWAGVGCVLLSAAAVLRLRGPLMRLHALAPASVAGVPMIAAAVALDQGLGRGAAKTLFVGLVFAVGGTVTTIAVGRATRQAEAQDGSQG